MKSIIRETPMLVSAEVTNSGMKRLFLHRRMDAGTELLFR